METTTLRHTFSTVLLINRLWAWWKGEAGTSSGEVVVGSAFVGIIAVLLSGLTTQMFQGTVTQRDNVIAMDQVARAQQLTVTDFGMAESVSLADGQSASTITLTHTDKDTGLPVTTTYTLNGDTLERSVESGPALAAARDVTSVTFSRSGKMIGVSVTVRPMDHDGTDTTRAWEVFRRPTG